MSVEQLKRVTDEMRENARKMTILDEAGDIQKYLASQLGINSYDVYELISRRKETTEALKQQIASLLKTFPTRQRRQDAVETVAQR